jgi:hypothetical protein
VSPTVFAVAPRRGRIPFVAAVAAFAILASAQATLAGSIGFRIDTEVKSGPGVDAKVTLTHTGDEAASDVNVRVEMLDRSADGTALAKVLPGKSQTWDLHLFDQIENGAYVIVVRASYADANGYPFEVVSTAPATVGGKAEPRVTGSLHPPKLTVDGSGTARLTLKKPLAREGAFEVRLIGPGGLEIQPERVAVDFDAKGEASAAFKMRNRKLLPGTSVNVYALVTGTGPNARQTDIVRGTVRIGAAVPRWTYEFFYQAAGAVALLLLLLELVAWRRKSE